MQGKLYVKFFSVLCLKRSTLIQTAKLSSALDMFYNKNTEK